MMTVGAVGCLAALAGLVLLAAEAVGRGTVGAQNLLGPAILCVLTFGLSAGTVIAGVKMKRLAQYELAVSFSFIAMLVPLNPLAVPVGIWSLIVLLRPDVRAAFGFDAEQPEKPVDMEPADWSPLVLGLVVIVPLLAVMAFGMWHTGSAWVLAALALPWLGLGIAGVSTDGSPSEKPTTWLAAVTFLLSLGLIAMGIWIQRSVWPLAGLAVGLAAAVAGVCLGAWGTASEQEDADQEDVEQEIKAGEEEEAPTDGLQTGAFFVGMVGAFRSWGLLSDSLWSKVFDGVRSGEMDGVTDLALALTGPVVLFGGIAMYHARYYWFAVVGCSLCTLSGAILPVIVGVWSLITLFDSKVHRLFVANSNEWAKTAASGPRHSSGKPVSSMGRGASWGGTIGDAWTDWWSERDSMVTRAVQMTLVAIHVVCLFAFLGFSASGGKSADGSRQFKHEIGVLSPWFSLEVSGGDDGGFSYVVHWSSWSWLVAALAFLVCYAYCRIERLHNPDAGYWYRPEAFMVVWGVLTFASMVFGLAMGFLSTMVGA